MKFTTAHAHILAKGTSPKFAAFVASDTEIVTLGKTHHRYRVSDGELVAKAKGIGELIAFAVSNDSTRLATSTEKLIDIRDAISLDSLGTVKLGGPTLALGFSMDGKLLAARHMDRVCTYQLPQLKKIADHECEWRSAMGCSIPA